MNEKFAESQLRVFVSSTMAELRDVRDVVASALQDQRIDPWVYESAAGARPDTVQKTCIEELARADVVVVLFHQQYGAETMTEFRQARKLGKPLFVYIRDKNVSRDPKLADFLALEVLDLRRGVTYDYFNSAIHLGQQIGRDIQAWLVRQYRETTAKVDRGYLSPSEKERLSGVAERLQKVTDEGLTRGEPLDMLAQDVRAWLKTLGYVFERHVYYEASYVEWIINVPQRRGYDRVLVRGTTGEVSLGDVKSGLQRADELNLDEAWIVSASRVSDAARRSLDEEPYQKVFCFTLDELIDEHADFSGYLSWLEEQINARSIDQLYVPLAATKDEIDRETGAVLGTSRYGAENGWLEGYIDKWLDDPSKEHISVLGEFGTGKTWFALHYAWAAARRYKDAKNRGVQRPRLPLVVPLRDYAKAVSVESLFSEFFFRRHEIPLPGYSAFEQLNRMGKLLLIFDGFDEMAAKIDRQKMINNFWELARVIVPGSKAILTCRTEHFPNAQEGRDLLNAKLRASTDNLSGKPPQFEVITLEKFDSKQVRRVLELRSSKETADRVLRNPYLLDLARRPVMTEFILDSLPDIEKGKPVDISRVYLYSIYRKMDRDITEERTFTSLADKLFFLCELSWEMLFTDQMSLNYRLFPDRLRRLFGEAVKEQKDLDHWHHDMTAQSLLIRNEDGDYSPAHRSLLEFFTAYKIAALLGILADDFVEVARKNKRKNFGLPAIDYCWSEYFGAYSDQPDSGTSPPLKNFIPEKYDELLNTFGTRPLTRAVTDLLIPMVNHDDPNLSEKMIGLIQETMDKEENASAYLGGNSATLLARLNSSALRGANLQSASLAEADLTNADMSRSHLCSADLRRCKLQNTDLTGSNARSANFSDAKFWGSTLEGSNLSEANLERAEFTEMGSVNALAFSPDGDMLASGGEDTNVHVWEVKRGEESFVLRGHKGEVSQLCWSPDGAFIASWSIEEEKIIVWEVSSRNAIRHVWSGVPLVRPGSLTLGFQGASSRVVLKRYGCDDAWAAPCEPGKDGLQYDYSQQCASGVEDALNIVVDSISIEFVKNTISCAFKSGSATICAHDGPITCLLLHPGRKFGASSSKDATIRLWDLRPFVSKNSIESWPIEGYRVQKPQSDSKNSVPEWYKSVSPTPPVGTVPNPRFGECLLTIEQKLNCRGLVLSDAKGIDVETLFWLKVRGAVVPKEP